MITKPICFLAAISTVLLLTSCDKLQPENPAEVNWLVGDWIVDREKTTGVFIDGAIAKLNLDPNSSSLTGKLAYAAGKKSAQSTVAKFLKPLDNLKFKFTETEYSKEGVGLGGEGVPYEIIARPAPNQITIKEQDGDQRTYVQEGRNIWYQETTPVPFKIYLIQE